MSFPRFLLVAALLSACGDDDALGDLDAALDASGRGDAGADAHRSDAGWDAETGVDAESGDTDRPDVDTLDAGTEVRLFPANGGLDYQLGGDYSPPEGVTIVSRDREGSPAAGLYNICYVNGFQIQPGEVGDWDDDLVLRDDAGAPVIDPDWDEALLDVSSADKRTRVVAVVGGWIDQCARDGFDAVEIDNLDTYSRSGGRISQDDAVATMALLSARSHAAGLAIAQKNSAEILDRAGEMGTDFVVAEECNRFTECGDYIAVYGDHVLMIEYREGDFSRGCALYGDTHALVLRDLNLTTPAARSYVFDDC